MIRPMPVGIFITARCPSTTSNQINNRCAPSQQNSAFLSINGHPAGSRHAVVRQARHFRHPATVQFLILALDLSTTCDEGLQAAAEISHAGARVGDGQDDQDDGDDGEGGEGVADGVIAVVAGVVFEVAALVHAD